MSPLERKFSKQYAKILLKLAEEDLKAAKALHKVGGIRFEIILFHAEQAIEKALKAALCWREIPVPLVHELIVVLQKFPANDLPPGGYDLHDLTPYATVKRYEEGVIELSLEEIQEIISKAETVLSWSKGKVF